MSSSDTDLRSKRDALFESWQYIACPDFSSYAHWDPINPTSNELHDPDSNPATIVIIGQVVTDKLAVDPLGNYQSQGEKQQQYQESDSRNTRDFSCVNAKQVIVMRRPTASLWKADYDAATAKLDILQEKVAKTNAPRQHLLDKDQNPPFVHVSFPLWDKKKYNNPDKYLNDPVAEEDDIIRSLQEEHDIRAKQTMEYGSYLPDSCADAFRSTTKTHHIHLIPVFLPNGKCVAPAELPIRLENAVIEVMFTLKHYYYGAAAGKFKQTRIGNTYTATIEQVMILQVNTVIPSPRREPTMKSIQSTPSSKKGKTPVGTKRASSQSPSESSPSASKKKRIEATASSSLLTMPPHEDESVEDRETSDIQQALM